MPFSLPQLPYSSNALEPFYDRETVEIHHGKHFNAYTQNFNKAIEAAGLEGKSVEYILTHLESAPEAQRAALRNHGGGYLNHKIFFENLAPKDSTKPSSGLTDAIAAKFGSMEVFQEQFSDKAAKHFGSGWAWLVENKAGQLEIIDTHDQVSPVSLGYKPLLTIDVWEHAYYLKYRNVRADWIKAFWSIIDWKIVDARRKSPVVAAK